MTLLQRLRGALVALLSISLIATQLAVASTVGLTLASATALSVCAAAVLLLGLARIDGLVAELSAPIEQVSAALAASTASHAHLQRLFRLWSAGQDTPFAPSPRAPLDAAPATAELRSLLGRAAAAQASWAELEDAVARVRDLARQAEAGEAAARAKHRSLLDGCLDPTWVLAHDGIVLDDNPAGRNLLGERGVAVGKAFTAGFRDRLAVVAALERARSRGELRALTLELDGDRRVELSASVLATGATEPPRLLVVLRDVGDIAAREAEANARATYARSLLEASVDPLFAIDPDGAITDVNEAAVLRTGIPRERLQGAPFATLFAETEAAKQAWARTLVEGRVLDVPLTFRHAGGASHHGAFNGTVYRSAAGRVEGVFAAVRDMSLARKAERERDAREWVSLGIARLNQVFQGQASTRELSRKLITELAEYTGAQVGAFFALDAEGESDALSLLASHAYTRRKGLSNRFGPGEGLVGQAALERKQVVLQDVPEDYLRVSSGLGEATPRSLCLTPLLFEGNVRGVIELATFATFSDGALEYLRQAGPMVAVALEAAVAREKVATALQRSQTLAAELEAQQESLRSANAELEEQTAQLKASDQKLRTQQGEIELANTELSQKNELLERQKAETEQARKILAAQAEEVALASKYKSEFLANMSHELRTPLNSLLLLARSLRDNATGNLSPDQIESATVIFDSGSDLLNLINEILDLSKIEAGKMELRPEEIQLSELERSLVSQFDHMARAQGLTLTVERGADAPTQVVSDAQRLGQVIKNLLGNALKFTEVGGVTVTFARPAPGARLDRSGLRASEAWVIHVRDTGIGIPLDKQRIIFEAFQQADSGDRRRFGGTGLGLSISRELAALLGGEIQLVSEPQKGSTFSVYLPLLVSNARAPIAPAHALPAPPPARAVTPAPGVAPQAHEPARRAIAPAFADDREHVQDHDHVILIVEDDPRFAKILAGHVRERGFKCIAAASGEEGLALAREHRPDGVVLDIQLPNMDGWAVLNSLKQDMSLRHIPVHIVSVEEYSAQNMRLGAIGHVSKPIGREQIEQMLERLQAASAQTDKRVLVVEDDEIMRKETVRLIRTGNVTVDEVSTGLEALDALRGGGFHLVVMDLGLPDMQGLELLKRLAAEKITVPPVIIHTNRELTTDEEFALRSYAESIIVKDVRSEERLIDEVALFLHRVVRDLPEENRRAILHLHESNEPLRGRKVLVVEDDMRTMFAMARMLAGHGVNPIKAENGERALALLAENPDIDLVLMDMMMPVLDGYEATRRIRAQAQHARLPILALTAKAMKEDRLKCLEAGATDYLSKPVDPDRLVSLMRVLLCR